MTDSEKGILKHKVLSIEWKIKRFFADCQKLGEYYTSPIFTIKYAGKIIKWHLRVYPKGNREEVKDYTSVYLCMGNVNKIQVTADYQLSFVAEEKGVAAWQMKDTQTFKADANCWGWPKFAEQHFISDPENNILNDDTLTISCEITLHPRYQIDTESFYDYDKWIDKIANGLGDYEALLESDAFTAVTFNVQEKKINAHKAILSCRSPVFKAMFEHEMREKRQNSVDIVDVDCDVMMELLRFIYSGKVNNIEKIASDLLIAADKYQVIELKALCEKTLYEKLTVDNAVEYLKLTDMCDTIQLRILAIEFVAAHYKAIVKKAGFEDVNSDLMYQIMLAVAERDLKNK